MTQMMIEDFILLEEYITGDLNKDELLKIEKLIATNKTAAKELQLRMEIDEAIKEKDIMNLRDHLEKIHNELEKPEVAKVYQLVAKKWHLIAASVTILIMVGTFIFSNINSSSTEHLYDAYYSIDDVHLTKRSAESQNGQLNLALSKFRDKEYNEVILLLNSSDNNMAQYYLGLAYMETGHFKSATASFQRIINHEQNIFVEQAKWYKALSLLKLHDKDEAIQLFTSISNDNNSYHEAANKILKKLK